MEPRGLGQIYDGIEPLSSAGFLRQEACHQACLLAVVDAADGAAEQNESVVVVTTVEQLPGASGNEVIS
ncbi:MAG: hypothetical protein L0Z50_34890 [Verrucomicrobiales bacterium]|nr:hypothetical protein [Verrucomicrobiales bacterium]